MIKLYKHANGHTHYWEAWKAGSRVVVHSGVIGNRGEIREIELGESVTSVDVVKHELEKLRSDGYRRIDEEEHFTLVVQYKNEGWGSEEDLSKRERVDELLNETLNRTGNGYCDGGDIGSGTINIFCYVVDPQVAIESVVMVLRHQSMLDGAIIAIHGPEDEVYKVLWPENFNGDFRLIDESL